MNLNNEAFILRRNQMIKNGYWFDKSIIESLNQAYEKYPNKVALVSYKSHKNSEEKFTYQDLWGLTNKAALGLQALGVKKNDVISCQLPNWWEFTILYLACNKIGAVINPLMPIFREYELNFILRHAETKVLVVPSSFKSFNHEDLAYKLQSNIKTLEHVIVVDGIGANSFNKRLIEHDLEGNYPKIEVDVHPDDVIQLIFTSGTTGEPKGVMHTSNTLYANILPYAKRLALSEDDIILMPSPMAHQTGFIYGLIMPIELKAKVVLQDVWDTSKAIELINSYQVGFTMASTPFLDDFSNHVLEKKTVIPSLKIFLCAGAPIPKSLIQKANKTLTTKIISAWGMTECGAITTTKIQDDDERSYNTDGIALEGMEVEIVNDNGDILPNDTPGNLIVRSCSNFIGYFKRPHLNDINFDGWFNTGDIATKDKSGYIRICGRKKDLIIRGGENIPVSEVESLLYKHSNISKVALVPYPDQRLGERACAVVQLKNSDEILVLEDIIRFLKKQNIAIQYIPEALEIVSEMPVTPSGKIQKFKLIETLKTKYSENSDD